MCICHWSHCILACTKPLHTIQGPECQPKIGIHSTILSDNLTIVRGFFTRFSPKSEQQFYLANYELAPLHFSQGHNDPRLVPPPYITLSTLITKYQKTHTSVETFITSASVWSVKKWAHLKSWLQEWWSWYLYVTGKVKANQTCNP